MNTPFSIPAINGALGEYVDGDWNPVAGAFDLATIARPGRVVTFRVAGDHVTPIAWLDLGRWALYLRAAVDGFGRIAIALQDGRDVPPFWPAIVVIGDTAAGTLREVRCPVTSFGQNCVEVVALISGWLVFVQTSKFTYWRGQLSPGGVWVSEVNLGMPPELSAAGTSQGFSQGAADGSIRFFDLDRASVPGLACPNVDGGLVVGQNGDAGPDRVRAVYDGRIFVAHLGTAMEPHVVKVPGSLAWLLTARTPHGPAVVLLEPPFTTETAEPKPDPKPDPKPEDPKEIPEMEELNEQHVGVIEAFAAKFPPPLTADKIQYARETWIPNLAAQMAFSFPGEGWGSKRGDPGRPPSPESIARRVGATLYGYDLMEGQGGDVSVPPRRPVFNPRARGENITGQTFMPYAAEDHLGAVVVPGPGPDPDPDPPPASNDPGIVGLLERSLGVQVAIVGALSAIAETLARVDTHLVEFHGTPTASVDFGQVVGKLDDLQRDVQAMHTGVVAKLGERLPRRVF